MGRKADSASGRVKGMTTNTILIIIVLILIFGGGGFFYRGRGRR